MAVYELGDRRPVIGKGSFVCEGATIIGDVTIGEECFVGPGARIRGDYGTITIGDGSAVEDNTVIHARPGERCTIGRKVTLGHGCIIHNATLEDWVVVGMGAVVSDYAQVGEWAVVAEGAVVKNKDVVPSRKIVAGVPAKVVADVGDGYVKQWTDFKGLYANLASHRYPKGYRRID